jgi:GNAT superfamily N-acetyltransferase
LADTKEAVMQIVQANDEHVSVFAKEYADLMHSTGAVTYDYQFGSRELFELIVNSLWQTPGTLFGFDVTTLTLDEGELLRIEVGFHAPGFEQRKKALGVLWAPFIEQKKVSTTTLKQIAKRTYQCSYRNAAIPARVYAIRALAVKPSHQGRRIGAKLVANTIEMQGAQDYAPCISMFYQTIQPSTSIARSAWSV